MVAPDYHVFVDPKDEMWLELIAEKLRALAYSSVDQYLADFTQMVTNARAYNSPGCGKYGEYGEDLSARDQALFLVSITVIKVLNARGQHQGSSTCMCS